MTVAAIEKPKVLPMIDLEYDFSTMQGKKFIAISIDPITDKCTYHWNGVSNQEIVFCCTHLINQIMNGDI